ncbi:class I SAM-dependent methyltransferase [Paraburkholderia aspalathi]|nr:class I SAM-dependent methyltransferase [Paraburkholderia aspalathi]MBK3780309.1 class I SAM-dependent methyltransferase [Paraburkholderia aspalathi]
MTTRNDLTLQFYDETAGAYAAKTRAVDMSRAHDLFLRFVPAGGHILDAGCGSGRDARAFMDRQFEVSAFDGSAEMAQLASEFLGMPVPALRFQDLEYSAQFDGIWACASLLHLEPQELDDVFARLFKALKPGWILYASFTHGADSARFEEGRLFSDMSRYRFAQLCEASGGQYLDHWFDPIPRRNRSWVSFLGRASSKVAS